MYEDLVSGRYKRHMAQLSRRPDQLKAPLWKKGIVESCVWMAAGCYFERPSFCCFTLKKVWPQSRSKEIVSLRHLVRWCKKRYWHFGPLRRIFIWVCPWWSSIVTTQVSSKCHGLSHSGAATDRHPMLWAHATVWNGELVIRTMSSDE